MKNSHKKHKSTNTFRFKSFSDRLNELDIRRTALYHIGHENEELIEDEESFFSQTVRKWSVLNLSQEYTQFQKQCQHIITLPQLLHHKEFVMELVLKTLGTATTLSLQPILEIVVVLSKELREDFYEYFEKILQKITNLLSGDDAEQVEWVLICLAFLFKSMKPFLKKNIKVIFKTVNPLLEGTTFPEYVTNFAAECFSFVARDVKDPRIVIDLVKENQQPSKGVGRLFFEIVKGVNGDWHSCTENFLESLFRSDLDSKIVADTVDFILGYIKPHNMGLFWNIIVNVMEKNVNNVFGVIEQVAKYKSGIFIRNTEKVVNMLIVSKDKSNDESSVEAIAEVASIILNTSGSTLAQMDTSRLIRKMLDVESEKVFEKFVWNMRNHPQFELLIWPSLIQYFENNLSDQTMDFIARILLEVNLKIRIRQIETAKTLLKICELSANFQDQSAFEKFLLSSLLYTKLETVKFDKIADILENMATDLCNQLHNQRMFFYLYAVINILMNTQHNLKETVFNQLISKVLPYCTENFGALSILDILLNSYNVNYLSLELFDKIQIVLSNNLSSSNHETRLRSAHILSLFTNVTGVEIYKIFYDVEAIIPTIYTYRDQLMLLQKLSADGGLYGALKKKEYQLDCLKFCLGCLYHNFKLIWDPILRLIEGYANVIEVDSFWGFYKQKLVETKNYINGEKSDGKPNEIALFNNKSIDMLYRNYGKIENSSNQENYRILLWRGLLSLGQICESNNRDIVTIFLQFIQSEYPKTDKYVIPTLLAQLNVFGKFVNPKQLYRESELKQFYLELLTNTNQELQKAGMDCLMSYKNKSVMPYKDHLYNLIDEKKFKDELVKLKIDRDGGVVQQEHREELIPILLRLLYGKMTMKSTNKNVSSQVRKGVVIRFLAGCTCDEIFWFIRMIFKSYRDILNEDLKKIPEKTKNVQWSSQKLQSSINLLELVQKQFGGSMGNDFLHFILKIIMMIGSISNENQALKNLRSKTMLSLINFVDHFHDYTWQDDELHAVFELFVWPYIEKLPKDCIHSPTPLLKLLSTWSRNANQFELLAREHPNKKGLTPMKCVIELLLIEKAKPVIYKTIMDIIEQLLTLDESSKIGTEIIRPYIGDILKRFRIALAKKSEKRGMSKQELLIISKLTSLVDDSETCDALLEILLPILIRQTQTAADEEILTQVMHTLNNLLTKVSHPENHLRKVAELFQDISQVTPRKLLCKILEKVTPDRKTTKIINDLNAWDKRWVEQPNYEKRLKALEEIKTKLSDNEVDLNLGLLVIYNCFHFLKYDKDMGLRDYCSELLRALIPHLVGENAKKPSEVNYLLDEVVLPIIRKYLRGKNDNIRNESIQLLGVLSRECFNSHQILRDLHHLSSKDDSEVDFFENLIHLQSHRHGRALLKFCSVNKENGFSSRTLTQFILPLASTYLLCEKYASKHTVIDAAIEAIGSACEVLPWSQYYAVLKFYLKKMRMDREYQKQLVRIVVVILDSFHFDLALDAQKDTVEHNKLTRLSGSLVQRVTHEIHKILIPTLNNSITRLSKFESKHKLNRRKRSFEREEEEMLRVPLALAIVKLLQKLPKEILETSLPGVFTKICMFLKSPLKSVRMLTRDILKKIMLSLGTGYLPPLLNQMTALLTKGFQVHVLSVTLHGVLDALSDRFKPGDIEDCLHNILEIALNDIFGEVSAEKELTKIAAHTPEAKTSSKSYLSLHIAARNIQETCLLDLLMPFKTHLANSQSKKVITKVQTCFQKIVQGLAENKNISQENLLIFIYGTTSESIPDLLPGTPKSTLTESEKERMRRTRPDSFLIPIEPRRRSGIVTKTVKINSQANAHVLIEFGLELLAISLKRKKLESLEYRPFLNPMVTILKDSLKSSHLTVTILSLKCLTSIWNNGYELTSMQDNIDELVELIFKILHKYFSADVSKKDDNFLLVRNCLKSIVALLRKCNYYILDDERLTQLLLYAEQDIHDFDRQPIAFSLLKAIVSRKLIVPDIHDVMKKLSEIAIVSESNYAQEESRTILLTYTMEYPLQKKVDTIVKFFVTQLNFEVSNGRLSACKFLQSLIKQFPNEILEKFSELLFLSLGTRLVNEPVPECRIEFATAVEDLLKKLQIETRKKLFDMTLLFFDSEKPAVREMAAVLCTRFVNLEKKDLEPRIHELLTILVEHLSKSNPKAAGRFVRATFDESAEDNESGRAIDHEIIQLQNCIHKILEKFRLHQMQPAVVDELAYESQKLLAHDHEWIRLNAIRILDNIISNLDFSLIEKFLLKENTTETTIYDFIYCNPEADIKSITLDLCAQMLPGDTKEETAEEIIKILLYIANMVKNVPNRSDSPKVNLQWLTRRIRYIIHGEISKAPHSIVLRTKVFDWIEGIVTLLNVEHIKEMANSLLAPLVREMSDTDQNIDQKLRQNALRVANKIRKKIGEKLYNELRVQLQTKLMIKRAERKKQIAQEKIYDPVRAGKRKQRIHERKKISKKRKLDINRGKISGTKRRKLDEDNFI